MNGKYIVLLVAIIVTALVDIQYASWIGLQYLGEWGLPILFGIVVVASFIVGKSHKNIPEIGVMIVFVLFFIAILNIDKISIEGPWGEVFNVAEYRNIISLNLGMLTFLVTFLWEGKKTK